MDFIPPLLKKCKNIVAATEELQKTLQAATEELLKKHCDSNRRTAKTIVAATEELQKNIAAATEELQNTSRQQPKNC